MCYPTHLDNHGQGHPSPRLHSRSSLNYLARERWSSFKSQSVLSIFFLLANSLIFYNPHAKQEMLPPSSRNRESNIYRPAWSRAMPNLNAEHASAVLPTTPITVQIWSAAITSNAAMSASLASNATWWSTPAIVTHAVDPSKYIRME